MSSLNPISPSQTLFNKTGHFKITETSTFFAKYSNLQSSFFPKIPPSSIRFLNHGQISKLPLKTVFISAAIAEKQKNNEQEKGFSAEMRLLAMKLHTKDQAKEGEKETKEPEERPLPTWKATTDGYLRFLVDNKLVYDTLHAIIAKAMFPFYAQFGNTGLERHECLAKDLEWFKEEGYVIPEPSSPGLNYTSYLQELSEKNPQAFICHLYNIYFAHSAGGRMVGKKVVEMIGINKELEFYKWEGDISQLLQNVKEKLNKVAESWSLEEKNHCLNEMEKAFKYNGEVLRLIQL